MHLLPSTFVNKLLIEGTAIFPLVINTAGKEPQSGFVLGHMLLKLLSQSS